MKSNFGKIVLFIFLLIVTTSLVFSASFDSTKPWHSLLQISPDNGATGVDTNDNGIIDNSDNAAVSSTSNSCNHDSTCETVNLTSSDTVNAPTICVNSDCRTTWPSGTGADGGWTNTSTTTSTNLDVNVGSGKLFFNSTSGNLGIGSTNPTQLLHVGGNTNVTGNVYTPQLCLDSDCRTTWPLGSTNNWNVTGNNIYPESLDYYVGIGMTNPSQALEVNGTTKSRHFIAESLAPSIQFNETGAAPNFGYWMATATDQTFRIMALNDSLEAAGNLFMLERDEDDVNALHFGYYYTPALYANATNNRVGIGTNSPTQALHVEGSANVTGNVYTPQICLSDDCRTVWPSGTGAEGGWTNTSTTTWESDLDVNVYRDGNIAYNLSNSSLYLTNRPVVIESLNATSSFSAALRADAGFPMVEFWKLGDSQPALQNDAVIGAIHAYPYNGTDYTSLAGIQFLVDDVTAGLPSTKISLKVTNKSSDFIDALVIRDNGNVGIGTTSPTQKLHVVGNVNVTDAIYSQYLVSQDGLAIIRPESGRVSFVETGYLGIPLADLPRWNIDANNDTFRIYREPNVSVGGQAPTFEMAADRGEVTYNDFVFLGNGSGTSIQLYGKNGYDGGGNPFSETISMFANNYTFSDFTSGINFIMDGSTGRIGIGNVNPTQKLHIEGNANITGSIYTPQLCLNDDCRTSWPTGGISVLDGGWTNTSSLTYTDLDVDVSGGDFVVNSSLGFVGIGKNIPTQKLHVEGSANVTGNISSPEFCLNDDCRTSWPTAGSSVLDGGWTNTSSLTYTALDVDVSGGDFVVNSSLGFVGIGKNIPTQKLHVEGNENLTGDLYIGGNVVSYGADFAERFSGSNVEPGDVVCLNNENKIEKCSMHGENSVIGVVSEKPSVSGAGLGGDIPVGITGIVTTKVKGPIVKFDLLTSSSVKGFAEKASSDDTGAIIGKSLDSCATECTIKVLVGLR